MEIWKQRWRWGKGRNLRGKHEIHPVLTYKRNGGACTYCAVMGNIII
jgi:hypothetical protein